MGEGRGSGSDFTEEEDTQRERKPDDRRTDQRVAAEFRVQYRTLDEFVVAYTADISRGGLFVATQNFQPIGSIIRLELVLPDDGPILNIIARVAYLLDANKASGHDRTQGMGVEFLDVEGGPLADQLAAYLTLSLSEQAPLKPPATSEILVVEDDAAYRDRAYAILRRKGHRVTVAKTGLEALGLVLREPPDLILSDVQMPMMDGWQLLRLLRARPSVAHIPVVFLTMLGGEDERLRGYNLGVDDYIAKPFRDEELCARIDRVLTRVRMRPRTTASKNALRGDLQQVSLASVLSFVELEKRTGHLLIVSDNELATLHLRNGQVVHVDLASVHEGKVGADRLYHVLDMAHGRFELTSVEVTTKDSVGVSTQFALLEHARRQDEA
jgi:uncharacterized protein (TIGR02266 family)